VVSVQLKDKESFESLYRRFSKRYRQSNLASEVKDKAYYTKKANKRLKKRAALVGKKIRETKEYLRKTGQLEKNQDYRGRLKIKVKIK